MHIKQRSITGTIIYPLPLLNSLAAMNHRELCQASADYPMSRADTRVNPGLVADGETLRRNEHDNP